MYLNQEGDFGNPSNNKLVFKNVETVDPKILGGILIRLNDLQYDATVKNKLNNVRKAFKI